MRKTNNGLLFLLLLIFYSCSSGENQKKQNLETIYNEKISSQFGEKFKTNLFKVSNDTLSNWITNKLLPDSTTSISGKLLVWKFQLDSVICINSVGNKLIGVIYQCGLSDDKDMHDGIHEFFGAKIDGQWYFWTGGYTPVGRTNLKNHDPTKPLPYSYLHQMGVGSLGGYLDNDGNIRDEWFEAKFKNPGWGTFKNRYEYKYKLDGQRIDNENDYWEYLWKRKGLGNWISKSCKDSIALREQLEGKPLADEDKREISMACSRKMMNSNFPLFKGKYKD